MKQLIFIVAIVCGCASNKPVPNPPDTAELTWGQYCDMAAITTCERASECGIITPSIEECQAGFKQRCCDVKDTLSTHCNERTIPFPNKAQQCAGKMKAIECNVYINDLLNSWNPNSRYYFPIRAKSCVRF